MKKPLMISTTALGWSLQYAAVAQTATADNKVSGSITFKELPKGRGVYGIFEGRSPCAAIGRQPVLACLQIVIILNGSSSFSGIA
jgi:hypothetical protein